MELSFALSCSHESLLWGLAQSIPEKTLRSFPPLPFSGSLLLHSESFRKARLLLAEGSFTDCVGKEGELCLIELARFKIVKITNPKTFKKHRLFIDYLISINIFET
jgi:hypothetical protein